MDFFIVALLTATLALFIRWLLSPSYKDLKLPPGPKALPILGNLPQIGVPPWIGLAKLAKDFGGVMFVRLGTLPAVVLSTSYALKRFHLDNSSTFLSRPLYLSNLSIMGDNGRSSIAASNGPVWRKARQAIMQLFLSKEGLQNYQTILENDLKLLVNNELPKLNQTVSKEPADNIHLFIRKQFTSIILHMMFDKRLEVNDARVLELCRAIDETFMALGKGNVLDFFPFLRWLPTPNKFRLQGNVRIMRTILHEFLDELKSSQAPELASSNCLALALLRMAKEKDLSDELIVAILEEVMMGFVEPTGNLVGWIITTLAKYPEVQTRVRDEVMSAFTPQQPFTLDDVANVPYLKAVVWETLRFGPFITMPPPRVAERNIRIDEMDIPKGSLVFSNMYAICKDPNHFPNPEVFNPERFLNVKSDLLEYDDPYFPPFNVGPRHCPGGRLAQLDSMMLISAIVRRYIIKPTSDASPSFEMDDNMIPKPKTPAQISFQPIQTAA